MTPRLQLWLFLTVAFATATGCSPDAKLPTDTSDRLAEPTVGRNVSGAAVTVNVSSVTQLRTAIADAAPFTKIVIAPGYYDLGDSALRVEWKTNLEIVGSGRGSTVLRIGPNSSYGIDLAGTNENVSIGNLTVTGTLPSNVQTHAVGTGGDRFNTVNVTFHDMEIKDAAIGIGIVASGNGYCSGVKILRNVISNIEEFWINGSTSGSGYGIHNEGCTDVQMVGNVISNVDRHSIYQAKAYQPDRPGPGVILIDRNLILDHAKTSQLDKEWLIAITVARSSNVIVSNNVIVNPYQNAMSIENPQEEGGYPVANVQLIGNTVLGTRYNKGDIYVSAAGRFIVWGNRYGRRGESGLTKTPRLQLAGNGVYSELVEPSGLQGSNSMSYSTVHPITWVEQGGYLHLLVPSYGADPSTWQRMSYVNSGTAYFEQLASGSGHLYLLFSGYIYEVSETTWQLRQLPHVFSPGAQIATTNNSLVVGIPEGRLYKIDHNTWAKTEIAARTGGRAGGLVAWGDDAYVMWDDCIYQISTTGVPTLSMGCG